MKLLEKNQLIGTSPGYAIFRDLFEKEDGERVSIKTSREFEIQKERTLPSGKLVKYPSQEEMFEKYKL